MIGTTTSRCRSLTGNESSNFMLCSVLIPSLWRFDKLKRAIKSFYATADKSQFEMLIRLQENDEESVRRQGELSGFGYNLTVFVGRPKPEGVGNSWLWNDMMQHATGDWHQYWSDDQTISGDWSTQLAALPIKGIVAQPEIHQLNNSRYLSDKLGPTPFIPRDAFTNTGMNELPEPIDTGGVLHLFKNGWNHVFLKGVGVHHIREADRTLPVA